MQSLGNIDAEMQDLAQAVKSESFMQLQEKFLLEHCMKFSPEEENKLEYTEIHQ